MNISRRTAQIVTTAASFTLALGPLRAATFFSDDFPTPTLDTALWPTTTDAAASDLGNNEPSPDYALELRGSGVATTKSLNTTGAPLLRLTYSWQRTGSNAANSPEPGEDLIVEYTKPLTVGWVTLATHPGDGPDDQPFQTNSITLPANTITNGLTIRFRTTGDSDDDRFYIDDVTLTDTVPVTYTRARPEPYAFRPGVDTFSYTIGVADTDITKITIANTPDVNFIQNGSVPTTIDFFDDGLLDDAVAGDRIFTASNLSIDTPPEHPFGVIHLPTFSATATRTDGSSTTQPVGAGWILGYLNASYPIPQVIEITSNSDTWMSPRVFNPVITFEGSYATGYDFSETDLIERYYMYMPDNRDLIMLIGAFSEASSASTNHFSFVNNYVQGIFPKNNSFAAFSFADNFGGAKSLRGRTRISPNRIADPRLMLHELMHSWAAFTPLDLDLNSNPDLNINAGHWGAILRPTTAFAFSGAYVSFDFDSEFGYWRATQGLPNDYYRFNDLELYLAGLIPIEHVQWPITVIDDATLSGFEPGPPRVDFYRSDTGLKQVTMNDFLDAMGPRFPTVEHSKKEFNIALIVASDRPLLPIEFAFYEAAISNFAAPTNTSGHPGVSFAQATGGLATLNPNLPLPGDCNANGIDDTIDFFNGASDCNGNTIPDECESTLDCNGNGILDLCELPGNDCNNNGILDVCDFARLFTPTPDWNRNFSIDFFDLLDFLDDWFNLTADYNLDLTTNFFDLLDFLENWFAPCPA